MREYEVVYIFRSELEDEEVESKLDSYHERLTGDGSGEVTAVEDWGKRQLAYPIEDQENGRYVVAHFSVDPEKLDEFERALKLDGDLLRHLVVLHEGELPTPPSARRPGAGPGDEESEEDEEEEETSAAEDAEDEEETEEDEEEEEPGDEEPEDEGPVDEEPAEDEEPGDEEPAEDEGPGDEEPAEDEGPGDEEPAEDEEPGDEEPAEDEGRAEASDEEQEKE